ncbi:hypothetical protein VAB18032_08165 [Micromonospora maris AB-18-032]|nr:hypothetical protein VAB18032_08165 [Micromonospora maris AB-18-032]
MRRLARLLVRRLPVRRLTRVRLAGLSVLRLPGLAGWPVLRLPVR